MSLSMARASGILLHPTSLPGPHGIGDLGPSAFRFLEFLQAAGQTLWQVLPLGPTGYGDSPYACFSSFAGNPLLISLEILVDWSYLSPSDIAAASNGAPPPAPSTAPHGSLSPVPALPGIDYGNVIRWKIPLLELAARRFLHSKGDPRATAFQSFAVDESAWLDDFCLFLALKDEFAGRSLDRGEATQRRGESSGLRGEPSGSRSGAWNDSWSRDIALREPIALESWKKRLAEEIEIRKAIQFFFFTQWSSLHRAAGSKGIRIIGDLPIFISTDSADVWANRNLFLLDDDGRPTVVSGVPPDYFSSTGQLWGNPLYDWEALKRQGFRFMIDRISSVLRLFDIVRIDHFRGFQACWTVSADEPTAERGVWVEAPGSALFEAVQRELGTLPIIAEDLGVITPEVNALRERLGFPGMKILQFAFDSAEEGGLSARNRFLPHNHTPDSVIYTGTHDNDTTLGWFKSRSEEERAYLERYIASSDMDIPWRFIRLAMASVCRFAIIPLQDALGLDSSARMNTPGTPGGNWTWRFDANVLDGPLARRLRELTGLYGRLPS